MATPATFSLPLLDHFATSPCLGQDISPLFGRLPVEIRRQIYGEVWRTFGSLCPHIATTAGPRVDGTLTAAAPGSRYFVTAPCLQTPDVPSTDVPPDDVAAVSTVPVLGDGGGGDGGDGDGDGDGDGSLRQWSIDLGPSGWSGHRECRDRSLRLPETVHYRPFLPLLLTCKRAYVEAVGLLYSSLTFQFADADTANVFLARWPCVSSVRLHMCLTSTLLAIFREDEPLVVDGMGGVAGSATSATSSASSSVPSSPLPLPTLSIGHRAREVDAPAWRRLCARIVALPRLRRLYVWVESSDQRPWYQIADEVRLFSGLFGVSTSTLATTPPTMPFSRIPSPVVVIALPIIPPDSNNSNPMANTHRLPPGSYLESGPDGASPCLPCTVRRTWRPSIRGRLLTDIQLMVHPQRRGLSIGSTGLILRQRPPRWP